MNKSESREVAKIAACAPHLGTDYAARAISALIRSSLRKTAQAEMLALACAQGWDKSDEFVVYPYFA